MKVRTGIRAGEGADFDLDDDEEFDEDSFEGDTQLGGFGNTPNTQGCTFEHPCVS
jgi:hypothetical protein